MLLIFPPDFTTQTVVPPKGCVGLKMVRLGFLFRCQVLGHTTFLTGTRNPIS